MKRVLSILFSVLTLVILLASCAKEQDVIVVSTDFQGEKWGRFDYINASYNVSKAPMTADLELNIAVSDVFPNIYPYHDDDNGVFQFVMTITSPDGSRRSREYSFRLKDSEGNFKSQNIGGYYNFELPLISEMSFNEAGDYQFKIENKYSKDPLYGIKSLSVKCLQTKNK